MSNVEELNEETQGVVEFPRLRLLQGGKGPPDAPWDNNWMLSFEVGSVFVARQNAKTCDWEMYYLIAKYSDDLFLLKYSVPDGKVWDRHIDPKLFCNLHRSYKLLWVNKQEETNDTGQRDPSGSDDVVLHETMQRSD